MDKDLVETVFGLSKPLHKLADLLTDPTMNTTGLLILEEGLIKAAETINNVRAMQTHREMRN